MRKTAIMVLFLLLCPVRAVLGQQSQGEWEPFKDVKDQKGQELARQQAGQPLTNESIIGLVKIGFSDETITSMIQHETGNYSLRVDDVIALKKAGVSEGVVAAMSSKMGIGPTPAPIAPAAGAPAGVMEKPDAATEPTPPRPRVFVTDSSSWEMAGSQGPRGGSFAGGARPQRAEIIKTFGERCPEVAVTIKSELADFVVILDHEGGKEPARRKNKVVVFNKDGDSFFSKSTRSLGNSVKDACDAISRAPMSASRPSSSAPLAPTAGAVQPAPASGSKEIKLGMTVADVDRILGPPATKVDLGEKVLYKYKDMTVEFHDGRVTDVR